MVPVAYCALRLPWTHLVITLWFHGFQPHHILQKLPEAKLTSRTRSVLSRWMALRSNAAWWERDQFGTGTSSGHF